jgi:hypothetical protein
MSDLNLTEIGTGESIINYTDHNTNYSSIETTVNNHMNDVSDFHNASGIVNDSGVTGANVDDALDELEDQIEAISSSANALIGAFSVTASGTNTYTGTFVDLTYFTDLKVLVTIPNSNTSQTVTLNINALGAKSIKYYDNDGNKQDPSIGMLKQNKSYLVQYDGTDFVLLTNAQAEIEAIEDRGVPFPIDEWIGQNTKTIWANNCDGTWEDDRYSGATAGTYTPTTDTDTFSIGLFGITGTATLSGGGIHIVFDADINLEEMTDGTSSDTSDRINWQIYMTSANQTKLSTGLRIIFHNDNEGTETNYMYYDMLKANINGDGKTFFSLAKSGFTQGGSGTWTGVKGLSIIFVGAPSSEATFTIDAIQMVSASGAFQRAGTADYTINSGTWYVGWDEAYKCNIIKDIQANSSDTDGLIGTKAYSDNFDISYTALFDSALEGQYMGWYKDSNDYIRARLTSSTNFRLVVYDSTGSNNFDATVPALTAGQLFTINIIRNRTSVYASVTTNGITYPVQGDTDTTGDGNLIISTQNGAADTILDFGITTTERASQAGMVCKD